MASNNITTEPLKDDDTEESSAQANSSKSNGPTIFIHILSPSTDVPQKLSFPAVPATTTVGELKTKIRDAVPTRPSLERQRLIHRGKVLSRESDNMVDVFGQTAVEDPVSQSLHLVLRPETSSQSSSEAMQRPNPTTSTNPNDVQPPQPPREGNSPHGPGVIGQGNNLRFNEGTNSNNSNPPNIPNPPVLPQSALPPQFQNMINSQIQNHLNNHFAHLHQHPGPHGPTNLPIRNDQAPRPSTDFANGLPPIPQFHDIVGQNQRARAASGMHGVASTPNQNSDNSNNVGPSERPSRGVSPGSNQVGQEGNQVLPGISNSYTREYQGPHGQRFQVTVHENTRVFSSPGGITGSGAPPGPNGSYNNIAQATTPNPIGISPSSQAANSSSHRDGHGADPDLLAFVEERRNHLTQLGNLQQEFERLETAARNGNPPNSDQIAEARQRLDHMMHHQDYLANRIVQNPPNAHPRGDGDILNRRTPRGSSNTTTPQNSSGQSLQPSILRSNHLPSLDPSTNASTTVYLLSSPTGPYGILTSPSGTYTTSNSIQSLNLNTNLNQGDGHARRQVQLQNGVRAENRQGGQAPPNLDAFLANPPQVQQAPRQRQDNQLRDHLRILFPLGFGGTLWLVVRLLGFIFFFGGGAGYWRSIIVPIIAGVIYGMQIGVFGGLQEALLAPLRRHLDGLMPLDQPRAEENRPQGAAGDAGGSGATGGQEPDPTDLASRLARRREETNRASLTEAVRRRLRNAERALVIFVASLVPGVGERHIAARDAAAAVQRQREEERARLEQESDQAAGGEGNTETAQVTNDSGNGGIEGQPDQNPATGASAGPSQAEQRHTTAPFSSEGGASTAPPQQQEQPQQGVAI
ncbi:MAG: hypothetical protein M1837_000031 [Sclerophora amabilis]|nr:MAG: hypothetical protein M1837_000031 [Sclerophora amabilis]